MLVKNTLINLVRRLMLPPQVGCTAIFLSNVLKGRFTLTPRQLAHLCLFLGCKLEGIHGHLQKIMASIDGCSTALLVENEVAALEALGFDLDFPDVYAKALAVRLLLLERECPVATSWEEDRERIERALCTDALYNEHEMKYNFTCNEIAFAVLGADPRLADSLGIEINADNIKRLMEDIEKTVLLADADLNGRTE